MTEVVEMEDQSGGGGSLWCVLPKKPVGSEASTPVKKDSAFTSLTPDADKLEKSRTRGFSDAQGGEANLIRRRGCPSPDSVVDALAFIPTEYDGATTDDDDWDDESSGTFQDTLTRSVRFADEEGLALTQVRLFVYERGLMSRLVVLLLDPQRKVFEFLHTEYPRDDSTTAQVFLEQLPKICTNPVFRFKKFVTLSKTKNQLLLDNDTSMKDFGLAEDELLLAVMDGYDVHEMASFALPLLLNGRIQKAVKHAKRTGKGLKTVRSGNVWRQQNSPQNSQLDESYAFKLGSVVQEIVTFKANKSTESESTVANPPLHEKSTKPVSPPEVQSSDAGESDALLTKDGNNAESDAWDPAADPIPVVEATDNATAKSEDDGPCSSSIASSESEHTRTEKSVAECTDQDGSEFDIPDIDDESKWKLPELRDYIGGEEATENVIFFIHAMSVVSAAGFLLAW